MRVDLLSFPVGCGRSGDVSSCHHVGCLHFHICTRGEPVTPFERYTSAALGIDVHVTLLVDVLYVPGDHEAHSHVSRGLLAEQAEPLRPAGHVVGRHLDRPALLFTGSTNS